MASWGPMVAWSSDNTISVVIGGLTLLVTLGLWWWERGQRKQDRKVAEQQRERDLEDARHQRDLDRRDVLVTVQLLRRSEPSGSPRSSGTAPTQISTYWWRLILTGGTAFSRAIVTKFSWNDGDSWHDALADIEGGVVMATGKPTHLRGPDPAFGDPRVYPVDIEWTVDEVPQSRHVTVFVEPWT